MNKESNPLNTEQEYWILSFYHFADLKEPKAFVKAHKDFLATDDYLGRIYISELGINGTLSAKVKAAKAYIDWLNAQAGFEDCVIKVHGHYEHSFPRMTVKYRKQLCALDKEIDPGCQANRLSPKEWKETLQNEEDCIVLDVRNHYEWQLGHFDRSEAIPCESFREFPDFVRKLKERCDPKKQKILMYCTGGIRCEYFSPYMKAEGFENLHQLDGGIVSYGKELADELWQGNLFVFDDRVSIPLGEKEKTAISPCRFCEEKSNRVYNCANMHCNSLFTCCSTCLEKHKGSCQETCESSSHLRSFQHSHKPFRKKHLCQEA